MPALVSIVSVNVGEPEVIGESRGKPVLSGIRKRRVAQPQLLLTILGLEGDHQVETQIIPSGKQLHGGPDKAAYVFPHDHYVEWRVELGIELPLPSFGENLTVGWVSENTTHIGDRWRWGEALLEVSEPRQPCSKLALHLGTTDVVRLMWANGFCGWYMRVLEPGLVPTDGTIEIVQRNHSAPTIADTFTAKRTKNWRP